MVIPPDRKRIVLGYTKGALRDNTPLDKIKAKLKGFGYSAEDIEDVINEAKLQQPEAKSFSEEKTKFNSRKLAVYGGFATFIILIVLAGFYFSRPGFTQEDCGNDISCFMSHANNCADSKLLMNENGTITMYQITGCSFKRTMTKLADEEPPVVKDLFENKSITCVYERSNFNPDLVNTLTYGLEDCEGDLKDAIYELILAQYELELGITD